MFQQLFDFSEPIEKIKKIWITNGLHDEFICYDFSSNYPLSIPFDSDEKAIEFLMNQKFFSFDQAKETIKKVKQNNDFSFMTNEIFF